MKKEQRLTVSYDTPDGLVTFTVLDAKDQKLAERTYKLRVLPEAIQAKVAGYGLNKLLTDRTSEQKDKVAKLDEMDAVFAMIQEGEWAKERVVGAIVVGVNVEALAQLKGWTIAFTQTTLAQYSKEERAKILVLDVVQKLAAQIREERKDATIASLDDMLS